MLKVDLAGNKDDANTTFVLSQEPVANGELLVIRNGLVLRRVLTDPAANDYTRAGDTLLLGTAPSASDSLFAFVQIGLTQSYSATSFVGLAAPGNVSFTLATAPPAGTNLLLIKNGLVLEEVVATPTDMQFTIADNVVTLGTPLASTDWVAAYVSNLASAELSPKVYAGNLDGANTRFVLDYAPPLNYEVDLLVTVDGVVYRRVTDSPVSGQYALLDPKTIRLGIAPNGSTALQFILFGVAPLAANPYTFTYDRIVQRLGIWVQRQLNDTELAELVREKYDEYTTMFQWSVLMFDGTFATVPMKSGGTVLVTTGARVVVGTDTAFTADDVGKRFRLSSYSNSYEIVNVNPATQELEINPAYADASATGNSYEIFKSVYALGPEVEYVFSMNSRWPMREIPLSVVNRLDPTRASRSDVPSRYAYRGRDGNNNLLIEIYPVPSQAHVIRYSGIRRDALADGSQVLKGIEALIMNAAALAAMPLIAAKKGAADPWMTLAAAYEKQVTMILERLDSLDLTRSDVAQIQGMRDDVAWTGDGAYMSEHDAWLIPGEW